MNPNQHPLKPSLLLSLLSFFIFLLCFLLLESFTGCVGYVERRPHAVYVEPSPPVIVEAEDDYVYYPQYEVYYSVHRHQYFYRDGGAWISRPAPRGVSVGVLFASPSVRMNFHDSPRYHHDVVVRSYPRNWSARVRVR